MPARRSSVRVSRMTLVPKPKRASKLQNTSTTKAKPTTTPNSSATRSERRSLSNKSESPRMPPPPHSRRAYIDSDDEEIRKSPPTKQRKVCESDEESSEDVGRQHPTASEASPSRRPNPRVLRKHVQKNKDEVTECKQSVRRASTRHLSTKSEEEEVKPRQSLNKLTDGQTLKRHKEATGIKFTESISIDTRRMIRPSPPWKTSPTAKHQVTTDNSDEVEAEFGVIFLRPPSDTVLHRLQFLQKQPQKMENCHGKIKQQVKHLELVYKTKKKEDGVAFNKLAALYDGVYRSESSTKGESMLRHGVGFFKTGTFYIMPITETFEMSRQITRPIDIDIIEQNRIEDSNLGFESFSPSVNPVRMRYARSETDWQRKRREQSIQYRQMLFDQDQWVDMEVKREDIKSVYKKETLKTRNPAEMLETPELPSI